MVAKLRKLVEADFNSRDALVLARGLDTVSGSGRLAKRLGAGRRLKAMRANTETRMWLVDRGLPIEEASVRATH